MSLQLPAPAKLNLFLRILGRRPDGYHELQTLFQLLDYGDTLDFELRSDSGLSVEAPGVDVPERDNLVYRAAQLLQNTCGTAQGAHIRLQKRLPAGGGIGGGSSDAATTLLGLNHLWRCGLSVDELAKLGRQLGADVPVFVAGHTALAEGTGERLVPVRTAPCHFLVLAPDCHVSTAAVFGHPGLTRDSAAITLAHLRDRVLDSDWLQSHAGNDCEPLVEQLYPEIQATRQWLQQHARAQLTGTGACVFAAFPSESEAQEVLEQRPEGWRGFIAASVNTSPAHTALAKLTSTSGK
ncbi:4-(cytidine 5'-diphospho)-2-C-methyl-D-erythritol kinase [Microbulbifer flavimaris]|uniref:4-diphosphocytidyl-2-C-methyl-D-erythritol kinase n=1 Tax=Microbulbifer flavimaris TaxID=1781068 RepID=A0ABX4I198_9GAMM|nr:MULTISPECIES: 4-(cytidine 5'-diphospho)-2-C-methyl-D-erythritol kinase [Microbulbifer]PCO06157.1 4-(cytidine 5'-diphospho)-2-C-methyl-D-erythritol kinase [Microbulbifer flavimaris]